MTLSKTALGLALLLATPTLAPSEEKRTAQPRSGSSSSSGSTARSSGAQHRSPSSSSVSSSSRSSRPSRGTSASAPSSAGRSSTFRPTTGAQSRHPRPGTGRLYRSSRYYGSRPYRYLGSSYYGSYWPSYYVGYYGQPWYFGPGFRTGFGYGYPSLYGYSYYPYYGGYGHGYGYYGARGYVTPPDTETVGLRIMIEPREARVYVDGAYAGEVDDFDGMFQRLYLEPGEHELAFELEGYRSYVLILDVAPGASLKVRHSMQEGGGEPVVDDRTGGRALRREARSSARAPRAPEERELSERDAPYERSETAHSPAQLRLDVTPKDASVYVDGEFRGTAGLLTARPLELEAGTHRVEIVRPGLRGVSREVTLESGESQELSAALEP